MKERSVSLRILKFLFAVCWWGTIGISLLMVILLPVVAVTSPEKIDLSLVGFARGVDSSALTATTHEGLASIIEFKEPVQVRLSLPADNWEPKWVYVLGGIVLGIAGAGLFLYFLKQFREIIQTVESGDPFVFENARRVRIIGLLILVGGFVGGLLETAGGIWADSMFVTEGFDLSTQIGLDFSTLISGLSIIVLSEIFRYGTQMREEQSLTV